VAYRVELSLPRVVQIGRSASLTLPVRNDADAQQTASGGTLTLTVGGVTVLDAVVIAPGPPASYALLAATTEDLSPSDEWVETWTLTGVERFTHTGFLVRKGYYSHVTDAALEQVHPELLQLLPPSETSAEKFRVQSSEWIQRQLLNKGSRPWLIWDEWALFDADQWYSLALWTNDLAFRTPNSQDLKERAKDYFDRAKAAFDGVSFRYDRDETGVIDADEVQTAAPGAMFLTAGRPRGGQWWG
jgi:hypothetical protein